MHILELCELTSLPQLHCWPCCCQITNIRMMKIRQKMCSLQALLIDTDCSNVDVLEDTAIRDLRKTISNAMDEESRKSRTGALWINYMDQVSLLKMFLYAERTGDWMLHLYCITKMIPYFHAAGHLAHAKSARLYLQQMKSLESTMSVNEYSQFTD